MPPKRKATRRQREDPSSSTRQPHHVMTQPVFLQKILPFAATSHLSPITFKSVSSSWLETQIHYSGEILCWKAFYEASENNREMVDKALWELCDNLASDWDEPELLFRATLLEPILEMSRLLNDQNCQRILNRLGGDMDTLFSLSAVGYVRGFELVLDIAHAKLGVSGLKHLIDATGRVFNVSATAHFFCNEIYNLVIAAPMAKILFDAMGKVGENYLKAQLESRERGQTLVMHACGSLGDEYFSVLRVLLKTIRALGKDYLVSHLQMTDNHMGKTPLMCTIFSKHCSYQAVQICAALVEVGLFDEQFSGLEDDHRAQLALYCIDSTFPSQAAFRRMMSLLCDYTPEFSVEPEQEAIFRYQSEEMEEILSDRSAADQVFFCDDDGKTILMVACRRCCSVEIVDYLFNFALNTYSSEDLKTVLRKKDKPSGVNILGYCCGSFFDEDIPSATFELLFKVMNQLNIFEELVCDLPKNLFDRVRKRMVENKITTAGQFVRLEKKRETKEKEEEEARVEKKLEKAISATEVPKNSTCKKDKKVTPKKTAGKKAVPKKQVDQKQKSRAKKANKKK